MNKAKASPEISVSVPAVLYRISDPALPLTKAECAQLAATLKNSKMALLIGSDGEPLSAIFLPLTDDPPATT